MEKKDKIIDPNKNIPTNEVEAFFIEYKKNLSGLSVFIKDFVKWVKGSKIWEDESGFMGVKAKGERIYFYTGDSGVYALFQRYMQAQFNTGLTVNGGHFNAGGGASTDTYDVYKSRMNGRIKLFTYPNETQYILSSATVVHIYSASDIQLHGNTYIYGTMSATGTKSFLIPHPDGSKRMLKYAAQESPDVQLNFRGRAKLDSKGNFTIIPPKHFVLVTEPEGLVTINLTPMAKDQGLFVKGIVKNESATIEGKPDTEFMYEWVAVRKGYLNFDCEPSNEPIPNPV